MKNTFLIAALTLAAPLVWGQTVTKTEKETVKTGEGTTTTEKTTTTTAGGTITEFTPGKTIILKETSGPVTYRVGPKVVYVNRAGAAIPEAEVQTRIKVGAPIHVHYAKDGEGMVISRVVLDE